MLEGRYSRTTRIMNGIEVNKYKRDMNLVYIVQQRVTRLMEGLWHFSCENRLRELGLISIEKEWLWGVSSMCRNTCRELVKRL